jgi:primosomal protein N' (replication factor Y)
VETIDLCVEYKQRGSRGAISRQLHKAIQTALDAGGQVILLLNRRGYATRIQCPACGHVMHCHQCAIPMTHHRDRRALMCHYCRFEEPEPHVCPKCNQGAIRFTGLGTQRLEMEIRARFPDAPCVRMDTDSMQRHGSHERALEQFRSGAKRILLGTQMIAKGLDFPDVTLVGVVYAEAALHLQDFRAAERTFSLVTQVAGRTGRGDRPGIVWVQTYTPNHYAIAAARRHDYAGFAAEELKHRRAFQYPPFGRLARVLVRGAAEAHADAMAAKLAGETRELIAATAAPLQLVGPSPAPLTRLHGKYRFHFLIKSPPDFDLPQWLAPLRASESSEGDLHWIIDVDPLEMV